MDETQIDELERRALAAWPQAEPRDDFCARVVASAAKAQPERPTQHKLRLIDADDTGVAANSTAALHESRAHRALPIPAAATRADIEALPSPKTFSRFLTPAGWAAGLAAGVVLGWLAYANFQPARDAPAGHGVAGELDASSADSGKSHPIFSGLQAKLATYLDQYGQNYGEAFRFHGTVAIRRGDHIAFLGRGTHRVGTQLEPDASTRFRIGAMTQPMVAVALMRLVERGELKLDENMGRLLPLLPWSTPQITVEQLLSHRSGLADSPHILLADMGLDSDIDTKTLLAEVARSPNQFPPGQRFSPNNVNYIALGMILEKLTKLDLAGALARELFEPAQMRHAVVLTPTMLLPESSLDWATGHDFSEDERLVAVQGRDAALLAGAGAVACSTEDLLRFADALHEGRLLSESSLRRMQAPAGEGFALGWAVTRQREQVAFGHPGGVRGFNSSILRMADGTTFVALANTQVVDATRIVADMEKILYEDVIPERSEQVEIPSTPEMAARLVGHYELSHSSRIEHEAAGIDERSFGVIEISERAGRLYMAFPEREAKAMYPMGGREFFFKDRPQSTALWQPDRRGEVSYIELRTGSLRLLYMPRSTKARHRPRK